MKYFASHDSIPEGFTGECKLYSDQTIRYYKNNQLHKEDGPALIFQNGDVEYYLNGLFHNENGPAIIYEYIKIWYYKGVKYGINNRHQNDFSNSSWREFIENKKREEQLEIFK